MVFCNVLEVLAEERAVEEGYDATICRKQLCALIGYAVYLATYAVALDKVAHTHTSCHKRYAVEEVLKQVLHGKTNTSSQACRYNRHSRRRYLEHLNGYNGIQSPAADGYHIVGKGEVWLAVHHYSRLVILMVESLYKIVEVSEDKELRAHHNQLVDRELHHACDVKEVELEYLPHRLGKVKHICSPPYRQQNREHAQYRNNSHIYHIVEPRNVDVLLVAYGYDAKQRAAFSLLGIFFRVNLMRQTVLLVSS